MVNNIQVELDTQESSFDVSMGVFEDNTFANLVGTNFTVQVPDKIFVGLTLGGESNLILQGRQCWATPR